MLIFVLQEAESSQINSTPLLQPLSAQILRKPCSFLQEQCLQHFKQYLSPFISANNLQLSTTSQPIDPDCPVFFYCQLSCVCNTKNQTNQQLTNKQGENYNNYMQTIFCKTVAYSQKEARQRRLKLVNSVLLKKKKRTASCAKHPKTSFKFDDTTIVSNVDKIIHRKQLHKVDTALIKCFGQQLSNHRVYVNGKQVHLLTGSDTSRQKQPKQKPTNIQSVKKWSELIDQKWDKWTSKNGCMYILY